LRLQIPSPGTRRGGPEAANGLSADRRNVSQFLGKVFNAAVRDGIINVSPLVRGGIRRPAVPQKDMQPLSVREVRVNPDPPLRHFTPERQRDDPGGGSALNPVAVDGR
jgi:hypothetical protein